MGLMLNHMSASAGLSNGAGRGNLSVIAVTGAMYMGPHDQFGVAGTAFAANPDAAYIWQNNGVNEKALFLGDVVISGSLTGGSGAFVDAAADAAQYRIGVFDDANTIGGDASLLWQNSTVIVSGGLEALSTTGDKIKLEASGSNIEVLNIASSTSLFLGEGVDNNNHTLIQITPHDMANQEKILIHNNAGSTGDAIKLKSKAGGIWIDADGSLNDAINIDSAGGVDIDATGLVALDGGTMSLDATGAANLTVTAGADAADLTIEMANDGTPRDSSILIKSAGTGADAIKLNASAGSVDIDSADNVTIDSADLMTLTTADTGADGKLSLVSGVASSNVAIHLDGNANAASIVDIDAGVLQINAAGVGHVISAGKLTLNGAGEDIGLSGATTTVKGALNVDQAVTLDTTLDVTGDTSVSTLDSTGATSLATAGGVVNIGSTGVATTVKGTFNVDEAATFDTNVTIAGNLDVNGTTTSIDTANMSVQDSIIALGVSGSGAFSNLGDRGVIFARSAALTDALPAIRYNGTKFELGKYIAGPLSQSFGTASSFLDLKVNNLELAGGLALPDSAGDHNLSLKADFDDLSGNRTLTFKVNNADRDLVLSGNLSVEGASIINQDLSSDSTAAAFGTLTLATSLLPDAPGGADIGSTTAEFGDIFIGDAKSLKLGIGQEHTITDAGPGLEIASAEAIEIKVADEQDGSLMNAAGDAYFKVAASATAGSEDLRIVNTNGTDVKAIEIRSVAGAVDISGEKASQAGAVSLVAKHDDSTIELKSGATPAVRFSVGNANAAFPTDNYEMHFGANAEIKLNHVHDQGLLLTGSIAGAFSSKLMFGDSGTSIGQVGDGILFASADKNIGLSVPSGATNGISFKTGMIDTLVFAPDAASFYPNSDNSFDLGMANKRYRNIYTADLNLRNDRGDWTLIEEEDFISFRNNATGRRFRMVMEDITGLGNYGPGNDGEM